MFLLYRIPGCTVQDMLRDPAFVTIKEAANILGVTIRTVRNYIKRPDHNGNYLDSYIVGHQYFVKETDALNYKPYFRNGRKPKKC